MLGKVSPFTIIGVTPPAFTGTLQVDYHPAVTVPIACEPLLRGRRSFLGTANAPGDWWLDVMGRLKPGATHEQARESLNSAFQTAALAVMPPPRKATEPAQLDPDDYPRLIAESGSCWPARDSPALTGRTRSPRDFPASALPIHGRSA